MTKTKVSIEDRKAREHWNACHLECDEGALSGQDPAEMILHHGLEALMRPSLVILDIGVGRGFAARHFREVYQATVDALDVADVAEKTVAGWVRAFYRAGEDRLPESEYDLAVSHLTAQHMTDTQLRAQVGAVGHALKPGGTFSLHLAGSYRPGEEDLRGPIPPGMDGRMVRSRDYAFALIREELGAGWTAKIAGRTLTFPEFESHWFFVHIRRDD